MYNQAHYNTAISNQFVTFVVDQFNKAIVELRNPKLDHIEDEDEAYNIRIVESEMADLFECVVNDFKFTNDWRDLITTLVRKCDDNTWDYFCYYMLDDDRQAAEQCGMTSDFINSWI